MFLSGPRSHIDEYLAWVRGAPRFADLEVNDAVICSAAADYRK